MSDEQKRKVLTLPSFPEIERDLMAAALIDPDYGPSIILGSLGEGDFTDPKCVAIYDAMSAIVARNESFDAESLIAELGAKGLAPAVGNDFVFDMVSRFVPNPSWTFEHHVKLVRNVSVARRIIMACRSVSVDFEKIASSSDGWEGFAERVRAKVNEICDGNATESFLSSSQAAEIALEEIRAAKGSSKDGLIGVTTGLGGLDRLTHGWQPGQLIVLAGKSSMGKSAFAVHSAYSAAKSGAEVAYFSLEMSNSSNLKRILSNESRVLAEKMVSGFASQDEMKRIEEAAKSVGSSPMWFTDRLSSYEEISAAITRLKARRPELKAAFIDYLQLMSTSQKGLTRDREIGIQTGGLKRLANKLGIAIVLLSQVNRGTGNDRPTMDNLRESGNIEQDANIVIFVHRPDYFDRTGPQTRISKAEIILAKNREGQTGTVKASFDKGISSFADIQGGE